MYHNLTKVLEQNLPRSKVADFTKMESDFFLHGFVTDPRVKNACRDLLLEAGKFIKLCFEQESVKSHRETNLSTGADDYLTDDILAYQLKGEEKEIAGSIQCYVSCCPEEEKVEGDARETPVVSATATFIPPSTFAVSKTTITTNETSGTQKQICKEGLIIIPDVIGWKSGRIRHLCDYFGSSKSMLAIVPNFRFHNKEGNLVIQHSL